MNSKWILVVMVLLALLVVPVMAISCNFQDYTGCNFGAVGSTTFDNYGYGTGAEIRGLRIIGGVGTYITQPTASISNYWAVTIFQVANPVNTYTMFYDSSKNQIAGHQINLGTGRYEFIYNPTNAHLYVYYNGAYHDDLGVTTGSVPPSYMDIKNFAGGENLILDDYTNEQPPINGVFISTIPPNWSIIKDFITPANSGIYAQSTLIRTSYMYSNLSYGVNATPSAKTWSLKNVATGITYETLSTSGWATGLTNNLNVLTDPASTAPNGLYTLTVIGGTGSYNHAYFWFTSTGATIAWDKDVYYSDGTSTITWTVQPAYWDTTTYSYQGDIVDVYGISKKSWTITTATGSESTTLDTTTYPMGVYFTKLTATLKASPFTAYILDTDYTSITQDIKINGLTYNATRGALFPSVFVNLTQLGTVRNDTSRATTAYYCQTGFVTGSPIVIEPNNNLATTGKLLWTPITFNPLSYGNFTINLYGTETLGNTSIHNDNATIYGLVRSLPYYNAIPGATVNIWNTTHYTSFLTNSTGYYNFTGLPNYTNFNMNATMTGYTNSVNEVVDTSTYSAGVWYNATRKDFLLSTMYSMTINFVDATTGSPIPAVTVTDSNGYTEVTTTGTYTHSYPYSLVSFYFAATGYIGASSSYIMDSDRTVTIRLAKSTTPVSNIYYTPWQVRIQIVDYYQNPLPNTNVSAFYVSSTLPSTSISWLVNAFAISSTVATDMTNSALAMAGQTDDNGGLSFTMFKSIQYNISIQNATNSINVYKLLYPSDQEYRIRVPLQNQIPLNNTLTQMAQTSLPVYLMGANTYNLSLIYQDTSGLTTNLQFNCSFRNGTYIFGQNMGAPGTGVVANNCTVTDSVMGDEIIWWYNSTRSGT